MAKGGGTTRSGGASDYVKNPNGRPGTYDLFRVGGTKTDSGMLFLSPSFGYAESYANQEGHIGQDTMRYSLSIQNPFVVELDRNVEIDNRYFTQKAYEQMTGKPSYNRRTGDPLNQLDMDKAIAKAFQKSKYDAIMYKGSDGRVFEVAVRPSALGEGRRVGKKDEFARRYKLTEEGYKEYQIRLNRRSDRTMEETRRIAEENYRRALRRLKQ